MPSPEELELQVKELRTQVAELSASMVEQEHRAFPILKNYFIERSKWEPGDPRRDAAAKALLWRIFFSPGAVAAAGGTVALVTAILLGVQTYLFRQQNESVLDQNAAIRESLLKTDEQLALQKQQLERSDEQFQRARRTELIAALYEGRGKPPQPNATPRTRREAVLEFVQIERARLAGPQPEIGPEYIPVVDLRDSLLQDLNLHGADLRYVDLRDSFLHGSYLGYAQLIGANLSSMVLDPRVSFYKADLRSANMSNSSVGGATFIGADLRGAVLRSALQRADFRRADLRGADITNAVLTEADLSSAVLGDLQLNVACANPDKPPLLPTGYDQPPPCINGES